MEILNVKVNTAMGFLIVIFGMMIYNLLLIRASQRVNKFSDIKFRIWWNETQIRFIMTLMVIMVIFYCSWYYDQLNAERCLFMGTAGSLVLDKFMQIMNIGNKPKSE